MRIGIAGLNALYWPISAGNYLIKKDGVQFVAAATLSEKDELIQSCLGLSPSDYAARYNLKLYDQAEKMVQDERLDTVILVTRHSEHAAWAERLTRLGVQIYIPKTFVTTREDADRMVRIEKQYGKKIAVGPSARFLPPMMALKRALDDGLIGKPFSLRICHHHGTIDVFKPHDWYRDPKEGGPELSLGWYGVDLALQLMGDTVRSTYARYANFTSPDSPFMDCGRLVLEMEHGGVASFDMLFCNRFRYPSWQVEIIGPKGMLSVRPNETDPGKSDIYLDYAEGHKALLPPERNPDWEMFWVDELLQGQTPSITAEYARYVTLLTLAARDSSAEGKVVPVIL